ncbi:MAG: DUF4190 domain-containing protein [Phycisphaerales bacterium]
MPESPKPAVAAAAAVPLSGRAALAGMLALLSLSGCVVAILLALVGVVHAMWAMLALPVLGIVAAVLGYTALKQIERSQGAVRGRVPALIGLFLGLITATTQVAMSIGPLSTFYALRNSLAPAMGRMFVELNRGDEAAASRYVSDSTEAPKLDRLTLVLRAAEARLGPVKGAEFDMSTLGMSARLAGSGAQSPAAAAPGAQSPGGPAAPDGQRIITLVFERGGALLVMWLDNPALERDEVKLLDGFIVLNSDQLASGARAEVLLLRADGPAARTAEYLGATIVQP